LILILILIKNMTTILIGLIGLALLYITGIIVQIIKIIIDSITIAFSRNIFNIIGKLNYNFEFTIVLGALTLSVVSIVIFVIREISHII